MAALPGFNTFPAAVPPPAALCRMSPGEAAFLDPQCRILLEQAYLAMAGAGGATGQPMPRDTGV